MNATMNSIGYACIFASSPEDARDNLLRLITQRIGGYDEGPEAWCAIMQEWLTGPYDLLDLNYCGARFSVEQWRTILQETIDRLGKPLSG